MDTHEWVSAQLPAALFRRLADRAGPRRRSALIRRAIEAELDRLDEADEAAGHDPDRTYATV